MLTFREATRYLQNPMVDQDLLFRVAYDIGHKFRGAAIGRKSHVDSPGRCPFIGLIGFDLIGKDGDRGDEGQKQQL
jgi:hypothetical protein